MAFFNLLSDLFLIAFLFYLLYALLHRHADVYGIRVYDQNNVLRADGRQGLETVFGTLAQKCDVLLSGTSGESGLVSLSYRPRAGRFIPQGAISPHEENIPSPARVRQIGGETFRLSLPPLISHNSLQIYHIFLAFFGFLLSQAFGEALLLHQYSVLALYGVLAIYLLLSWQLRADHLPTVELILCIFLTFYIEAGFYQYQHGHQTFLSAWQDTLLGISLYCGLAFVTNFLLRLDWTQHRKALSVFRFLAVGCIFLCFFLSYFRGAGRTDDPISAALINVRIASRTIQVTEFVKLFFLFCMVDPVLAKGSKAQRIFFGLFLPMLVMLYSLLIRDTGLILQLGAVWFLSVLLQGASLRNSLLMMGGGLLGCGLVLRLSRTAYTRVTNWLGSEGVVEALHGGGIWANQQGTGWQPTHALTAVFANGRLLGARGFSVLSGLKSVDTDLVTAYIGERHGVPCLALLVLLVLVLLVTVRLNLRQQKRFQQVFALLSATQITVAFLLSFGGTFGVLMLTGLVCPALSDGISAAVCYGVLFGALSATNLTPAYLDTMRRRTLLDPSYLAETPSLRERLKALPASLWHALFPQKSPSPKPEAAPQSPPVAAASPSFPSDTASDDLDQTLIPLKK